MPLFAEADPTTLSYWLNWRVFVCAVWVLTSMVAALVLIWKYERQDDSESDEQRSGVTRNDELWKPCLKEIHPVLLMSYRIVSFCLLFFMLECRHRSPRLSVIFLLYAFASVLSVNGCYHYLKRNSSNNSHLPEDTEQGLQVPLTQGVNGNRVRLSERSGYSGRSHPLQTTGMWACLFQVLYQMTAGAVTLTDVVYWCVIFPFMTLRDYEMNFIVIRTWFSWKCVYWLLFLNNRMAKEFLCHSLNLILLLGDTALNRLPFPWFRISYYIMWTAIYVIFQWIIHACVPIWWPYHFLDLSRPSSPLWYLIVAVMHLPFYGLYKLVVTVKYLVLSKWFPHSYP